MTTLTLKLPKALDQQLTAAAKRRRMTNAVRYLRPAAIDFPRSPGQHVQANSREPTERRHSR